MSEKSGVSSKAEHHSDAVETRGSNPVRRTNFFEWGRPLGRPDSPYVYRWMINFWLFSIRVHKWVGPDDGRAFHDHPWWYIAMVVKGCYADVGQWKPRLMLPFRPRLFRATHRHYVYPWVVPTWSVLLTGRETRQWGFWVDGKFRKRNKYFFEHGHH